MSPAGIQPDGDDSLADKFEELAKNLERLDTMGRTGLLKGLRDRCACPSCPTYTECARSNKELLFCIEGKSPTCITKAVRCICDTCPVELEYGMKNLFYCIEGSEAEKRRRRAERAKARAQGPIGVE